MNTPLHPSLKPDAAPMVPWPDKDQPSKDQLDNSAPSVRSVAGLLVIASLFALASGSLDAYT